MSKELRQALGRFCTGVVVVSAEHDGRVHAMTANAFTSVSLDPPLVLVSIGEKTRMHELLPAASGFGISVLGAEQELLARQFAGQSRADADFEHRLGVPVLRDAIARFTCSHATRHAAGDHTLYIGRVTSHAAREGEPLVFHSGCFGRIDAELALS